MKKYAIIDMTNGDQFEDIFNTSFEAIKRADYEWDIMSQHDKDRREFYAVMFGEVDEDGCFGMNTAEIVKQYK